MARNAPTIQHTHETSALMQPWLLPQLWSFHIAPIMIETGDVNVALSSMSFPSGPEVPVAVHDDDDLNS